MKNLDDKTVYITLLKGYMQTQTYTIATCEQTHTAHFFQITPRFFPKVALKESLNPFFFQLRNTVL